MRNKKQFFCPKGALAILTIISLLLSLLIFNHYARSIDNFNAKLRNYVITGKWDRIAFDNEGKPVLSKPRLGEYISPFYMVHFGLLHSEACRRGVNETRFHWRQDKSLEFWPRISHPSLTTFEAILRWLIEHLEINDNGLVHFMYNFNWPYKGYPGDMVRAPWWSGLTDGYAILLFLRGYDCFRNDRYLWVAQKLYRSVTAPVSEGGSLVKWEGQPWIEEYVDPRADPRQFSHVLNGMLYAYKGIRAYEEIASSNSKVFSEELLRSIKFHIPKFDLGLWSYYDAIGTRANIKYHAINWALISDPLFSDVVPRDMRERWYIGVRFPALYLIYGARSISYFHTLATLGLIFLMTGFLLWRILYVPVICKKGGE